METTVEREARWEAESAARQTRVEQMQAKLDELVLIGKIEWHCAGRHGVALGLHRSTGEMAAVVELLNFFGFRKHIWREGRDLEFHQSGSKPWSWCGETVLFKDWKANEERQAAARQMFSIGDQVRFSYHGRSYTGIIANMNKRATVVVPGEQTRWYMPATDLTKVI